MLVMNATVTNWLSYNRFHYIGKNERSPFSSVLWICLQLLQFLMSVTIPIFLLLRPLSPSTCPRMILRCRKFLYNIYPNQDDLLFLLFSANCFLSYSRQYFIVSHSISPIHFNHFCHNHISTLSRYLSSFFFMVSVPHSGGHIKHTPRKTLANIFLVGRNRNSSYCRQWF